MAIKDNLREVAKQQIFKMIRSVQPESGWKLLVVDKESLRMISSICQMNEIVNEGVTLVERLDLRRQPLPNMEAIYLMSPTDESVDAFLADWPEMKRKKKKKEVQVGQYHKSHLFFTTHLPDELLTRISSQERAVAHIATLTELNLDFLAPEPQVFTLDDKDCFKNLYSPESLGSEKRAAYERAAQQLLTLCASLGEYPQIRYKVGDAAGSAIAAHLQDKLDNLKAVNPTYVTTDKRGAGTLLVLGRDFDPLSPLMHELTYQAAVQDFIPLENGTIFKHPKKDPKTGATVTAKAVLDENDPMWTTLRHMHIAAAINYLQSNFSAFQKGKGALVENLRKGKDMEVSDMSDAIKAMPEFQETVRQYSLHLNISGNVMEFFDLHKLDDVVALEQDLAVGQDPRGAAIKPKVLVQRLKDIMESSSWTDEEKLRVLLVFIITQGGFEDSTRGELMGGLPSADSNTIINATNLGINLRKKKKLLSMSGGSTMKGFGTLDKNCDYDQSRYLPEMTVLVDKIIGGSLPAADYPYTKAPAAGGKKAGGSSRSLRRNKAKWNDDSKDPSSALVGGSRVIVFVAGGVTPSEMREAYNATTRHRREVIVGGSTMLSPSDFVSQLRDLNEAASIDF